MPTCITYILFTVCGMPTSLLLHNILGVLAQNRLLRPGSTILSYPKLIVMEKAFAALMLATPRIRQPYRRKAEGSTAISGLDTAHANRAAMASAVLSLPSE